MIARLKVKLKWPHPKEYTRVMTEHLDEDKAVDGPMALYQWFIEHWDRPLNPEKMKQAYLAAWAVAIDRGMVEL